MSILFIVSTPIGNLKDITLRALECLKEVDLILAEDTRHTRILLDHYGISTSLISLHQHNEHARAEQVLAWLREGKRLALVSDAGTPLISDPGFTLIHFLRASGFQAIQSVPGPCALIAGVSVSGLDTRRFRFEGFLPTGAQERKQRLRTYLTETATLIFYEAPHRLEKCLKSIQEVFGDARRMVLAKELTKMYETLQSGTATELLAWLNEDEKRFRGEFVLMIEGAPIQAASLEAPVSLEVDRLLSVLMDHMPQKTAIQCVETLTGLKRNGLYERALGLKAEANLEVQARAGEME